MTFTPPGLNVATTFTYADAARATSGAAVLRQLASLVEVAGQIGAAPRLQNLTIGADGVPTSGSRFTLDEEALKRSLASVLKLFASATAALPG